MLPVLEKISSGQNSAIAVKYEVCRYLEYPWHFHPEYELIWIEKGYGMRFMGNHVENFKDGELVFISPELPHVWKNHIDFHNKRKKLETRCIVIHFREEGLGKGFFDTPDLKNIRKLFELGKQGILFDQTTSAEVIPILKKLPVTLGVNRMLLFLQILKIISEAKKMKLLASKNYLFRSNPKDTNRMGKIYDYCTRYFTHEVDLNKIATIAGISGASFCRYFKQRTGKTFTRFINEIRIANACKKLIEEETTIAEACYSSGYNNISHFNRQFKIITGNTAKNYIKRFSKEIQ